MKPTLSQNLLLRTFRAKDITAAYVRGLNDQEVVGLTEARHTKWTRAKVEKFVDESNIPGVTELIGIFIQETGKHIGNIRLIGFSHRHRRVELGIMIFDKSEWGKGYGTEAIQVVADYVFKTLKLHKLSADYYAVNAGSKRMFERAGFKVEGVFKDHFLLGKRWIDSIRVYKLPLGKSK